MRSRGGVWLAMAAFAGAAVGVGCSATDSGTTALVDASMPTPATGSADAGLPRVAPSDSAPVDPDSSVDSGVPVARDAGTSDTGAASSVSEAAAPASVPDAATGDGGAGYGGDGPIAYTTSSFTVTNGADTFTVNTWIPSSSGAHPVVSFSPGLEQPCTGYAGYATRLASWGFVVLMRDDPGILVSGDTVAADLTYTVGTWLPAQNTTAGNALYGTADLTRVGLAGHSRGGQTTLVAAEQGLLGKVQAWVGLDPVDTAYSAGTAPSTDLPSIGIPTLYIGAGVATNCAPVGDNYQLLYSDSPSPSIALTVANASHSQFEDVGNCSICGLLCSPMGTANSQAVLADATRYLTAYFARLLQGDSSVGVLFQGAGAPADEASGAIAIVSK